MIINKFIALPAFILATANMAYGSADVGVEESKEGDYDGSFASAAAGEGVGVGNSVASAAAVDLDAETPEQTAARKARIAKAREDFAQRAAVNPAVKIEEYLGKSRILQSAPSNKKAEIEAAIKQGMNAYITKFGGKWPGIEPFKGAEQFCWNLQVLCPDSIKELFACANTLNWQDFMEFCNPFLAELDADTKSMSIDRLFPIFLAYPTPDSRTPFLAFCEPFFAGADVETKSIYMAMLLPIFRAYPTDEGRATFMAFCEPYLVGLDVGTKSSHMNSLLPIFQAYPTDEGRAAFMTFCEPFLAGLDADRKLMRMDSLLPIFQAYPTPEARATFMAFCEPYLTGVVVDCKATSMTRLLPIFQAFSTPADRETFMAFCEPYLVGVYADRKVNNIATLLPIFQAYSTPEARVAFMTFCEPYLVGVYADYKAYSISTLLPIFQTLSTPADHTAFLAFCEPYLTGLDADRKLMHMNSLLPIFQALSKDEKFAQNLTAFMGIHNTTNKFSVISSFLPRTYLQYMRSTAALQAESGAALLPARIQALYETDQFNQLPVLWGADPFLAEVLGAAGVANTHDFETLYAQDYATFVGWCTDAGYTGTLSATPRHIHNNAFSIPAHHTNAEVEDFITYLDTIVAIGPQLLLDGKVIQPARAISLVKQMLGLEQKTSGTTGGFAPYLGHSMFYAKPDSPKGDELLGRVWYMMKKIGEGKPDAQDYKKSVVLAILEAAEISGGVTHTHCQTRMTGELMKLLAWHLPGSKLRSLIAAQDLLPATTDAGIRARIAFAPDRARQLFATIHREDTGEVRKLREHHIIAMTDPELWELYKAYYDDLYRRTKIGGVYVFDANTLTRDNFGNLVRAHQADGTLRPADAVEIVYHQAEFQVLEMTFTELMRKEFEEQRGLKY